MNVTCVTPALSDRNPSSGRSIKPGGVGGTNPARVDFEEPMLLSFFFELSLESYRALLLAFLTMN